MILILTLPLAAALVCLRAPLPAVRMVTAVAGVSSFGLVLALVPAAAHGDIAYLRLLRVDAVSAVFLLATGFLYGAIAVYSIGYMSAGHDSERGARYSRRFWLGLSLFAWAGVVPPVVGPLCLLG